MASLNSEHSEKRKADFQWFDIDFEIMQVYTQIIYNGWERENLKKTKEKIKYHESRFMEATCALGIIIMEKEILKLIREKEGKRLNSKIWTHENFKINFKIK